MFPYIQHWGKLSHSLTLQVLKQSPLKNIELFFCLYGHDWDNPEMCNSSHSRLLGFFSTLPGIWRTLQCLRRYWDTGNKFPHLANCLKYLVTVAYYISLSVYRMHKTNELFAIFIAFATVNAFYCSRSFYLQLSSQ